MPFNSIIDQLSKNLFIRNVLAVSSGTVIAQLLLICATPLLTRLYNPKEFGVFAVFTSLLSFFTIASSMRYEIAIPLPKSHRHASYVVALSLLINIFVSLLILLITNFFSRQIAFFTKTPLIEHYLWLLPFGVFCLGSYKIFNYWAIRNQAYTTVAKTKIVQSISSIIIQIFSGLIGQGAIGLIVGRLVGQSAGTWTLAKDFNIKAYWLNDGYRIIFQILEIGKKYKNFFKYDTVASIIDTVNSQFPQILLAVMFGPVTSGYYMLVDRVLAMPASLIGQAVGQVFYGDWRTIQDTDLLLKKTIKIINALVALIILPTVLIFFLSASIFPIIFGHKWTMAGIFATWMIWGSAAQFVYSPISMALMATNGQKINLAIHSFLLILRSLAFTIGYFSQNSLLTIQMLSFSNMLIYGTGTILIIQRVKKYTLDPKKI